MRIAGITIPDDKRLEIGLTSVYGVGRSRARQILTEAKIEPNVRAKDLSEDKEAKVRSLVEEYAIEGDLKRDVSSNIKRLKDIKAYRGTRHTKGLPVRGRKTKTNARTVPSGIHAKTRKRVTMGSGKRKVDKK